MESFFGSPFSRPSSIAPQLNRWSPRASTWTNVNKSVVSMLHPEMWGNWWFEVESLNTSNPVKPILKFSRGGWQDAQGASAKNGTAFFIENLVSQSFNFSCFVVHPELATDVRSLRNWTHQLNGTTMATPGASTTSRTRQQLLTTP